MRELYHRLFGARGWFSRTASAGQWFKSSFVDEPPVITATLDATEQPDTFGAAALLAFPAFLDVSEQPDTFEGTALHVPPGVIIGYLNATEPPDTFEGFATHRRRRIIAEGSSNNWGFPKVKPPPVEARLYAQEQPDRMAFSVIVRDTPSPVPVPPMPAPSAAGIIPDQAPLLGVEPVEVIEPVPTLKASILCKLYTVEPSDTMRAKAGVTDWVAIDNDLLMMT